MLVTIRLEKQASIYFIFGIFAYMFFVFIFIIYVMMMLEDISTHMFK